MRGGAKEHESNEALPFVITTSGGTFGSYVSERKQRPNGRTRRMIAVALIVVISIKLYFYFTSLHVPCGTKLDNALYNSPNPDFFYTYHNATSLCPGPEAKSRSYAGHIGMKGDSEKAPKRSFFWFFEAENDPKNAPIILTFGGGPGSSGLLNPLLGQSPCLIVKDGLAPNPHRWTEHFNLLAVDHPIGAGFSYGTHVNNTVDASLDLYDLVQKFFQIRDVHHQDELYNNKFFIQSGSYGGVYVPNIASTIHHQNLDIARGNNLHLGRRHVNLEALMVSNPFSDPTSYYSFALEYNCVTHQLYNSTTCAELYPFLPQCINSLQLAYEHTGDPQIDTGRRVQATVDCDPIISGDLHGIVKEDIRIKCEEQGDPELPSTCHPKFGWAQDFFNDTKTRSALGIPEDVSYVPVSKHVGEEFWGYGDPIFRHHVLYEPLLESGIRLLHFIGRQDANCAWPGVFSMLKLIRSPFQEDFIGAPDIPWSPHTASLPKENKFAGSVRKVGGAPAGNMTMIYMEEAGHFVVSDQPALAKAIIENWIWNKPWF